MKRYHEIFRAKQLPVFQNRMFQSSEEARNCVKGDIDLVQDIETGLIFNHAFSQELMQYDADYQNEQAGSTVFKDHLKNVLSIVGRHFSGLSLIEVGCGKGYFLGQLQKQGFSVTGIDPTYEGTNSLVIKNYFTPGLGLRADGIILRHVLEHVRDPVNFLSSIRDSNGGVGKIYVEVPCFDWICEHRAWFDIFYEHVNYFRQADFYRMFGKVYESGHVFGGQYLYIVADLSTLKPPVYIDEEMFVLPSDFLHTINHYAKNLIHRSQACRTRHNSVVWGGASKGVIFSLFMQRAGVQLDYVVDINPAKQGKYIATTGLKISAPNEVVDKIGLESDIFVMNSNYLDEIKKSTGNQYNYLTVDHEIV